MGRFRVFTLNCCFFSCSYCRSYVRAPTSIPGRGRPLAAMQALGCQFVASFPCLCSDQQHYDVARSLSLDGSFTFFAFAKSKVTPAVLEFFSSTLYGFLC